MKIFPSTLVVTLALALSPTVHADELADIAALIDDGWVDSAQSRLETLADQNPDDAEVWYRLAWARYYRLDFDEAEKHIDRALKLDPDNVDYILLQGHTVGGRAQRGSKLKALGRAKKCKKCYERVLELDPDNVEGHLSLIQYNLQAPGMAGGDQDRARALAGELTAIDPVEGHLMKGLILARADEDVEGALQAYRAAFTASLGDPEKRRRAAAFLVGTLYREERYDDIESIMEKGLEIPDREVESRTALARLHTHKKDWDAARAQWRILADRDSTRGHGLAGLANLAEWRKDLEGAAALYDSAFAAAPDKRQYLYQAARVRAKAGSDPERAAADMRT